MLAPVRIALVGCGKMGQHHLQELSRVNTSHEIVGFYDLNKVFAEQLAKSWKAPAFDSIEQLCAVAKPDIIHICTPPDFHFEHAMDAIHGGANVYIEKPFVQTEDEAKILFAAAREKNLIVCAGYQQVHDPAFLQLMDRVSRLGEALIIESRFAFNPARFSVKQATQNMMGEQLLDILPHPLYTLLSAIETLAPGEENNLEIEFLSTSPTDIFVVIKCGEMRAQLDVSLLARPVESTLRVCTQSGSQTADFVRGIVFGAGNDGTQALEKIFNPIVEGFQLQFRSTLSLFKRIIGGESYPGLARLFDKFYASVANGQPSPISEGHILQVVCLYQRLAVEIRKKAMEISANETEVLSSVDNDAPIILVTGAGGLLGKRICRALVRKNFRVRAVGRTDKSSTVPAHEWIVSDLSQGLPAHALLGVETIIHAAAETSGGFPEHERNSVDATSKLIEGAHAAGVGKFIFVSSLAVLEPRWWRSEPLTEDSPRVVDPKSMGPYIWGKSTSEEIVERESRRLDLDYRIVRPAALVDYADSSLPGRLGKKLYGNLYLCLGRGGLPFAAIDVDTAGEVIAGFASSFDTGNTPKILNLIDSTIETRRQLLARYRQNGWAGHSIWVPISILASAIMSIKFVMGLLKGKGAEQVSAWKVLKPRSYDSSLAKKVIGENKSAASNVVKKNNI